MRPMIRLDRVTVAYSPAITVGPCSFHLRAGEMTVLLGSSGSGKSTLLRSMNGLVRPTAGSVWAEDLGSLAS